MQLKLHPAESRAPGTTIEAKLIRDSAQTLTLQFEIQNSTHVSFGDRVDAIRCDDLWRETCFECFLSREGESIYFEWNLAPSGCWQFYRFDSYRSNCTRPEMLPPERLANGPKTWSWRLMLPVELTAGVLESSVAMVMIESNPKTESSPFYWASSHRGAKPDFHLRSSIEYSVANWRES